MSLKEKIKDYFSFSNQEKKGIIVLLSILLIIIFSSYTYDLINNPNKSQFDISEYREAILEFESELTKSDIDSIKYFYFDPGTIDSLNLLKLGFKPYQARILLNYRRKGGKFYKKQDLKKIYSVSEKMYTNLEPYIVIKKKKKRYVKTTQILDINKAEARDLMNSGIDSKISWRIINFRKVLGGFYSLSQLNDVYDITEEQLKIITKKFTIKSGVFRKININEISYETLKKHPYFRKKASEIIKSRDQNKFDNTYDLVKRKIFTETEYKKIEKYLDL